MAISRGPPRTFRFQPGEEREIFLREVASILESDVAEIQAGASLTETYGVDELEVFEFIQIAEDIWDVRLNPDPMAGADWSTMMRRFRTLDSIIAAAEAASGK